MKPPFKVLVMVTSFIMLSLAYYGWTNREIIIDKSTATSRKTTEMCQNPANASHNLSTGNRKVVILLTQTRSGSSVLGELFNQRSDVVYLYEPLYPFPSRPCNSMLKERLEVLRKIFDCDFQLNEYHLKAFNASKLTDKASKCKTKKVCFTGAPKMSRFLSRDAGLCKSDKRKFQHCPSPINLDSLSKHCKGSMLIAMKVNYLCRLEYLLPLLRDSSFNLKVVHLIRDPRAVVNSHITGNSNPDKDAVFKRWLRGACERVTPDVQFADQNLSHQEELQHKYLRIRHEDFSMDPLQTAQNIYDFVAINMNEDVKKFLLNATSLINSETLSIKDPQSTTRNVKYVVSAWRKRLTINQVKAVQDICGKTLAKLGYRNFYTQNELLDIERFASF